MLSYRTLTKVFGNKLIGPGSVVPLIKTSRLRKNRFFANCFQAIVVVFWKILFRTNGRHWIIRVGPKLVFQYWSFADLRSWLPMLMLFSLNHQMAISIETISYEIQARSFKVANLLVPDTLELISELKLKNSRNLSLKLVLRSNDLESIFWILDSPSSRFGQILPYIVEWIVGQRIEDRKPG